MQRLGRYPVLAALLGALCIAWSAPLVRLAEVPPSTAAVGRCLLAVPLLLLVARAEDRRHGPLPLRSRQLAWIAGAFFAVDLVLWHHAIDAVGAGLATVLGNLQVLVVGVLAWWLLGERPHRGLVAAVPVLLVGVALVSGAVGADAYGRDPRLGVVLGVGTSIAYAAFLLVLRSGSSDLRRVAGPLMHATASAAAVALVLGLLLGELAVPSGTALLWLLLLAVSSQVVGWLLISSSLPRLPAAVTSALLLTQPLGALAVAAVLFGEDPSPVQYAGAALILAGVVLATATRRRAAPVVSERAPLAA